MCSLLTTECVPFFLQNVFPSYYRVCSLLMQREQELIEQSLNMQKTLIASEAQVTSFQVLQQHTEAQETSFQVLQQHTLSFYAEDLECL